MDDTSATLLLTRPEPQSQAFLAECEAEMKRRLPVVISPLLRIENIGDIPDLDNFDTIILTSGNGVARLGPALAGRRVFTVGERTAALARAHGAEASALGENVEAFLDHATEIKGKALFCRGVHSRGELAARLVSGGVEIEEAVLYDQVAVPLSNAASLLLTGEDPVVAPVFSPRTARLLSASLITAPLTVLAISPATAKAWTSRGRILIAETPDAFAMRGLVTQAF